MNVRDVEADLIAEQSSLDTIIAELSDDEWSRPTPSPGWSVADQIGHLTYFDGTAATAITDPERFAQLADELLAATGSDTAGDDLTLSAYRSMSPTELVRVWRRNRAVLADAAARLADDDRVVWYGPSMGSKSFLTARLMEVWAHGQDICDALDLDHPRTDRIRHIAQLGFITHNWTYVNRQLPPPTTPVFVQLNAPSGDVWNFGSGDANNSIKGPAVDFCMVVTQRRHVDDTELEVKGRAARDWMEKAQAFAGPPTDGPPPGRSTT
ncbi:MAG: TIGR03084 family protein [Ilumatobacter sp.]|nr:TIGR03084 family protein [Ilumatobacter sp.]